MNKIENPETTIEVLFNDSIGKTHNFIVSENIKKYSNYCDREKLNGLICFWCQNLQEAKFLSKNHQKNGHEIKIINLDK